MALITVNPAPLSPSPWLTTLIESLDAERTSPLGEPLPRFPSVEMQTNTTGLSAEAALRQAHAFYADVAHAADTVGVPLDAQTRALDFGFGWGRISRVFMERLSARNIHGLDVDPSFVEITRDLFGSDNFERCDAFPPTRHADASFDLVYAYSVFSHLSERATLAWMSEFARITRPGGLVAWTTRHATFFDFCKWAADQGDAVSGYVQAIGRLFPDLGEVRARHARGEFVHASSPGVGGGGPRDESFYGETWIPVDYARRAFAEDFEMVAAYFDGTRYDQTCFVFRRR